MKMRIFAFLATAVALLLPCHSVRAQGNVGGLGGFGGGFGGAMPATVSLIGTRGAELLTVQWGSSFPPTSKPTGSVFWRDNSGGQVSGVPEIIDISMRKSYLEGPCSWRGKAARFRLWLRQNVPSPNAEGSFLPPKSGYSIKVQVSGKTVAHSEGDFEGFTPLMMMNPATDFPQDVFAQQPQETREQSIARIQADITALESQLTAQKSTLAKLKGAIP